MQAQQRWQHTSEAKPLEGWLHRLDQKTGHEDWLHRLARPSEVCCCVSGCRLVAVFQAAAKIVSSFSTARLSSIFSTTATSRDKRSNANW